MVPKLFLDGNQLKSEAEFHDAIVRQLNPPVYGRNPDALWEVLTELVEPPIHVTWINAGATKKVLGGRFKIYLKLFEDAKDELPSDKYTLVLKI